MSGAEAYRVRADEVETGGDRLNFDGRADEWGMGGWRDGWTANDKQEAQHMHSTRLTSQLEGVTSV